MEEPRSATAVVTELRLSAYRSLRGRTVPLTPLTLLAGPSGSGKSTVLEAYAALARLGGGATLGEVFDGGGAGPSAYVPQRSRRDAQGRRGFRLGCTVDGPAGPVRCDLAVQAEPELRVAGERLTGPDGRTLLSTALRDPGRRTVAAEWYSAGVSRVVRAPLPDDRLGTALLPLRVAGTTEGQRYVLAAAEQVVVALRSAFPCDPRPSVMREPVGPAEGRLWSDCGNVAAVLHRTRTECSVRHGLLVEAVRAGCAGPVEDLDTEPAGKGRKQRVRAMLRRGPGRACTPLEWLGEGELRYIALALVLMTGPGVLSMDPAEEVLPARQALTVLADGLDRSLDARQRRGLLSLARRMADRGHVRVMAAVGDAYRADSGQRGGPGTSLVDLGA